MSKIHNVMLALLLAIFVATLVPQTATAQVQIMYAKSRANVRAGPGTSYEIVNTIGRGSPIRVNRGVEGSWWPVIRDGERIGYIYRTLVANNRPPADAEADAERRRGIAATAERRRRFGAQPRPSAWDGTYREVKDYLRRVANDPESIEIDVCTGVYHTNEGWLVGCDYRGRNAFGGMIRQSNWFVIRNGTVVAMKDADAYRP